MSPTTVMEPDSDRRASMRSCIGERSCTSSTTMWPKARMSSSDTVATLARGLRRGGQTLGPEPHLGRRALLGPLGAHPGRTSPAGTEERARLVDEGGVAHRPRHRLERGAAGPVQPLHLERTEDPLACRRQERPGAEQIVEELVGRQARPHAVEGITDLGHPAQPLGQILLLLGGRGVVRSVHAAPAEPGAVLVGQHAQDV